MKKVFLILLILSLCCLSALGQESGNRNYNRDTRTSGRRAAPNTGIIYNNGELFIEAYVLFNAPPDEFVAVFGAAQGRQVDSRGRQEFVRIDRAGMRRVEDDRRTPMRRLHDLERGRQLAIKLGHRGAPSLEYPHSLWADRSCDRFCRRREGFVRMYCP